MSMLQSRRTFLKQTAAVAGGLAALPILAAESAAGEETPTGTLPRRVLGRTKVKVSLLGIGLAPLGSDQTSVAEAEAVVHSALDQGITYVDVSPDYGNAEEKLKGVLQRRRDSLFLVTKVNPGAPTSAGVQKQIEE